MSSSTSMSLSAGSSRSSRSLRGSSRSSSRAGVFGARQAGHVRATATDAPRIEKTENAKQDAMTRTQRAVFPFVRVVGQDQVKTALILNMVDPKIGGVLIMGDRGTGKSTAVRGLMTLLPEIDVVEGDAYNSSPSDPELMGPDCIDAFRENGGEPLPNATTVSTPLVELPLGATEDRICGTIDIEKALAQGIKAFEPGLLAKAHRGILYVDEVNLLDDNIVDVVLDSAAGGWNTVEREGISVSHPSQYILVGSGNPDEGEMRPQLLDRFGMSVEVTTIMNSEERVQLVKERRAFDNDPESYLEAVMPEEEDLRKRIAEARLRLDNVVVPRPLKVKIAGLCAELGVDGLRGDLVVNRVARAYVAFSQPEKTEVEADDVAAIVSICLNHRMRKDPLDPIDGGYKVAMMFRKIFNSDDWEAEQAAKKKAEEEAAAKAAAELKENPRSGKKAGAWGGLP